MGTSYDVLTVRIIARKTLKDFWTRHASAEGPMSAWYTHVSRATYKSTQDIKNDFRSADFLPGNRVVFDIGGNNYRIVVVALLNAGTLYVRFVGTHAEYKKIDATKV